MTEIGTGYDALAQSGELWHRVPPHICTVIVAGASAGMLVGNGATFVPSGPPTIIGGAACGHGWSNLSCVCLFSYVQELPMLSVIMRYCS